MKMKIGEEEITSAIINVEHRQVGFFERIMVPGPFGIESGTMNLVAVLDLAPDSKALNALEEFLMESLGAIEREHKKRG